MNILLFSVLLIVVAGGCLGVVSRRILRRKVQSLEKKALREVSVMQQLVLEVTETAKQFSASSKELTGTCQQMIAGTEITSSQASMVSDATDHISRSVQTAAAASEEMTGSIGEISKNAAEAAKVAN